MITCYRENTFLLSASMLSQVASLLRAGFFLMAYLYFTSGGLFSQSTNFKIENITFPEGNQLAYAYYIEQDASGLIWIQVGRDFYTYNGHVLAKVEPEGLGFEEHGNRLLFGAQGYPYFHLDGKDLLVYDPVSNEVIRRIDVLPENLGSLPKPTTIRYTDISGDSVIWGLANIDNVGAYVVRSLHGGPFQLIEHIDISWYYDFTVVRDDHFFVKMRDRVEEFDVNGKVKSHLFPSGPDPVMPNIVKDDENTIWTIHSPDKLKDQYAVYYLREDADEFVRLEPGKRFPQEKKQGTIFSDGTYIWHRGYPFSLSRLRLSAGQAGTVDGTIEDFTAQIIEKNQHLPIFNSTLLNVFRDRSDQIWMTTRAGIVKMTIEEGLFDKFRVGQLDFNCKTGDCKIKGVAEDGAGNVYFSYDNGIIVYSPKTGRRSRLPLNIPPQKQSEHALTCAQGKLFWNEYVIDLQTLAVGKIFNSSTYDYLAHGLSPDGEQLWIGVNDWPFQLIAYDISTGETRQFELPESIFVSINYEIRHVHVSPATGSVFLAVWGVGMYEVDTNGQQLHHYFDNRTADDKWQWHGNLLYGMHEGTDGQLWIAHGVDAGLSKLDLKTREITRYPYRVNPFTGSLNRVFKILPYRDDFLWLVSEKGTMLLNKKTGELTRFAMFPTLSEMAYHRLPAHVSREGLFYIGTPDGAINEFATERLFEAAGFDQAYPVVIDRYGRFNEKEDSLFTQLKGVANLSEIHLTHRDRYFDLHYFVPDYRNTGQNLYSHWLEGYEKDWSTPARVNQLRYENLPPGDYTLHIRGGLGPEYFESSERVIQVFVARAWYKTWWAYLLYAAAVLGVSYFFYRQKLNRELEKAESLRLRELDSLKSRLYTNITHEFRTPLTVIMGNLEIMKLEIERYSPNFPISQFLISKAAIIRRNSKNLLRLINQLLDLSKLDSGTMKMDVVQSDIINYLQYLTESFHSMAHEKKVNLTFYAEIPELVMDFDEVKIQHVVYNLLSNAIKFTGEGGKVVLHASETERNGQPFLKLKVQDSGIGIPEGQLKHIFDRFFQADNSSTRKSEGTGIGLALTKELVELMGGSIAVKSMHGSGTTFTLLLPVRLDANTPAPQTEFQTSRSLAPELVPDVPATQPNYTATEEVEAPAGEKPVLLVIEDNADVVTYVVGLLKKDYEVHTAPNGQVGIEMALEMIPDVIISDVMMPEKDGYEVCDTLKNDELTSHIPIVLLTAKAEDSDRIEGLKKGADAYLMKPFNKEELFVRLEKLLELRRALQQRYSGASNAVSTEPTLDDIFLQKLRDAVLENIGDPSLNVEQLSRAVLLSTSQLYRKLAALTGEPPNTFIRKIRLHRAMEMLKTTELTISEIAYDVGFNDPNYFSRAFSKEFGEPPSTYRN